MKVGRRKEEKYKGPNSPGDPSFIYGKQRCKCECAYPVVGCHMLVY